MAQDRVTLNEIMTAVREITFDRFIIPAFAIKEMGAGYFICIDKTFTPEVSDPNVEVIKGKLSIYKEVPGNGITEETRQVIVELAFQEYQTLESIMDALIEAGIVVAYTPYFRGTESSSSLIQVTKELTESFTSFRRYFFSDDEIEKLIRWYYWKVLDIQDVELTEDIIGKLQRPSEQHMALWVSYYVCDKRRLYESAAGSIGQTFTDGSDYVGSNLSEGTGLTTTTQIGSVFSITEDPSKGYFYEDFNRIGSENVLGDRYSFWYRLQCWIRQQLEEIFGDYSLRKDNVMMGNIVLTRELDFRSYFDSYPFTLSPLSRGILSKTP